MVRMTDDDSGLAEAYALPWVGMPKFSTTTGIRELHLPAQAARRFLSAL